MAKINETRVVIFNFYVYHILKVHNMHVVVTDFNCGVGDMSTTQCVKTFSWIGTKFWP